MNQIRDILNKIKWQSKYNIAKIEIWYIHRGAPNNTKIISGADIKSIRKTFLETDDAMIPHHRIFKITYENKTLFVRNEKSS